MHVPFWYAMSPEQELWHEMHDINSSKRHDLNTMYFISSIVAAGSVDVDGCSMSSLYSVKMNLHVGVDKLKLTLL